MSTFPLPKLKRGGEMSKLRSSIICIVVKENGIQTSVYYHTSRLFPIIGCLLVVFCSDRSIN